MPGPLLSEFYGKACFKRRAQNCRAEINSKIINKLEYIQKFAKPFLYFCVLLSATARHFSVELKSSYSRANLAWQ